MRIEPPLLSIGRRVRFHHVWQALERVPRAPRRVLDAGCGDGRLARRMADRWPGAKVVALDGDNDAVAAASRRDTTGRVDWIHGEIPGARDGAPFDVIVCTDVLEHIRDDAAAMAWFASELSDRGWLVLHVPAANQTHAFAAVRAAIDRELASGAGPHTREGYTRDDLTGIARGAGLEPVAIAYTFHRPASRLAVDLESWAFLTGRRWVKALALPLLMVAGATERRASAEGTGNGLLVIARSAS